MFYILEMSYPFNDHVKKFLYQYIKRITSLTEMMILMVTVNRNGIMQKRAVSGVKIDVAMEA